MQSTVLIIEARSEKAAALEAGLAAANLVAVVVPHAAIARLPPDRPPVVAIAWEDDDDIPRLCETLMRVVQG